MADLARRNTRFEASREPLRGEPDLRLQRDKTSGPFPSFNPTRARFTLIAKRSLRKDDDDDDDDSRGSEGGALAGGTDEKLPSNVEYKYSKRDNRKGR